MDLEGNVWSTEHGPMGGDERNLLTAGQNYGWPYATYGTDYGRFEWGTATPHNETTDFHGPVYAWTPSVGVSNLVRVTHDQFSRWRGNLLVASLRGQMLFRVVLDEGRVAYVETLPIERSIRDLGEGSSGDILLWSDRGRLITLSTASTFARGATAFEACSVCHTLEYVSGGLGPSLLNIVGGRVASLRSLGGIWTAKRLDAFLADPASLAPGTPMTYRMEDPAERAAVVAFLQDQRSYFYD